MKKISALILAVVLACTSVFSQASKSDVDSSVVSNRHAVVASIIINSDTIFQTTVDTTNTAVVFSSIKSAKTPKIKKQDGALVLSYDGNDFVLADLVDDDVSVDLQQSLSDFDFEQSISDKEEHNFAALVVAMIFGIPCLTIIIGLFIALSYVYKRNRSRNELINKAIEYNYQLPEAFYLGQKNINSSPTSSVRDSRKFYRATTLIAVGLSLSIFAIWVDAAFFVVAGGIPLLMGIGQLIGYYCVPTSPINPSNPTYYGSQMGNRYPMPQHQPQEPINQPISRPSQTDEPSCDQQTPPPHNHSEHSSL